MFIVRIFFEVEISFFHSEIIRGAIQEFDAAEHSRLAVIHPNVNAFVGNVVLLYDVPHPAG